MDAEGAGPETSSVDGPPLKHIPARQRATSVPTS